MGHRRRHLRSNCTVRNMIRLGEFFPGQRGRLGQKSMALRAALLFSCILLTACRGVGPVQNPDPNLGQNSQDSGSTAPLSSEDALAGDALALDPQLPREASAVLLQESWDAYRQQFIQADGRVIDWEAEGRSTSESQAYAMLRAVLIDDPETFARTLKWGEDNLQRREDSTGDHLWAWKWGEQSPASLEVSEPSDRDAQQTGTKSVSPSGVDPSSVNPSDAKPELALAAAPAPPEMIWGIIDGNFAVDADIDAVTALILASRRWNEPAYLALAQTKLGDIWEHSTATIGDTRYLLPGPKAAFEKDDHLILNPSYYAPYAFRLFAQVDPERDWMALADASYDLLDQVMALSAAALPSDWVALDRDTQMVIPLDGTDEDNGENLISHYAFDAYRVWWRVSLDAVWFDTPAAERFLQENLNYLEQQWRLQQTIPAQMTLTGQATVDYEATSQYGMLYAAFRHLNMPVAQSIFQKKLLPSYQDGIWDDPSAYYSQNLAWLGLFPMDSLSSRLLQP